MEELADKGTLSNFFTRLETELEMRAYATTDEKRGAIFPKIRNVRSLYTPYMLHTPYYPPDTIYQRRAIFPKIRNVRSLYTPYMLYRLRGVSI